MATLAPPQPAAKSAPAAVRPAVRPVVLLILDGFGCRADAPDNAITRARMPNWDRLLAKLGFKDVYHLQGGFKAWKDAGLPVQKP